MLYTESFGTGPDVILLHGLFGAGDNWRSVGKKLSESYRVHLIDLPNHGRSPWINDPDLPRLAQILNDWINHKKITQYRLLGHSMGGKVAMELALNEHEGSLEQLIIVDIAPKTYEPHHQDVFAALNSVDFAQAKDRKAVDEHMKSLVPEDGIRQFLLKSLYNNNGQLDWRFNLPVLEDKYDAVACRPHVEVPFEGPTLFIKGMNSQYILPEDQETILTLFPNAKAKLIEGAGHWPHAEKPVAFTKIVSDFLKEI